MSGVAYWTENVIALFLRTHHCWEIKRKLPKFTQYIQKNMEKMKEKQKERPNISSSMKNATYYILNFNNLYSFIEIARRNSLSYTY
jgi:negative regulator of genetic competence, sporulation and motility